MTHDPLCPIAGDCKDNASGLHWLIREVFCEWCWDKCQCDLIAKVRVDERNRCIAEVEALGPLYQFKKWIAEDGCPAFSQETVDVAEVLRSQP